jgi:hypothetical protein
MSRPLAGVALGLGSALLAIGALGLRAAETARPASAAVGAAHHGLSSAAHRVSAQGEPRVLTIHRVVASPAQVRAAAPQYAPGDGLGGWQQAMATEFPRTYAGLEVNSSGEYIVRTVGTAGALRGFALGHFTALVGGRGAVHLGARSAVSSAGNASSPTPTPVGIGFQTATYSYDQLVAVKADILANSQFMSSGVLGAGLDVPGNAVSVTTTGGPVDAALANAYGNEVEVADATSTGTLDASRTNDSPPWNGGDEIISPSGVICTLGFGLSDATTGLSYSLTAGHCGSHKWYNTTASAMQMNSSTYVGQTTSGTVLKSGIDAQLVSDNSSCIVWGQGGTRYFITGYANAPGGATLLGEGAITGNSSGTVVMTDWSGNIAGESLANVDLTTLPLASGDSGGPVIYPTVYGPLAEGTEVGTITYSGGLTYGVIQEIDAELYTYTAMIGDQILPNVSATGSSC